MTLYGRVQEVCVRDFEFLRLISEGSLDVLVTKVTEQVRNSEGEESKEGYIYPVSYTHLTLPTILRV